MAAPNALLVAPVIIRTGQPVMAFGGFFGNDPVLSVDAFAEQVERGEVRFVVLGNRARRATSSAGCGPTARRSTSRNGARSRPSGRRAIQLYDVKPD